MKKSLYTLFIAILLYSCGNSTKNTINDIYFKQVTIDDNLSSWVEYLAYKNNELFSGKLNYYQTDICGAPENLQIPEELILYYFGTWGKMKENILRVEENYKNGKLEGVCRDFHANGSLHREITYSNGKIIGDIKIDPEHNSSASILSSDYEGPYNTVSQHDVSYHRVKSSFYCCGYKIKNHVEYLGKFFNGGILYNNYNRFGMYKTENYNSGKLDGKTINYYSNGTIEYIRNYTDGCPSGIWKRFDIDGNLLSETFYNRETGKEIHYSTKKIEGDNITRINLINYFIVDQGAYKNKEYYCTQYYSYYGNTSKIKTIKHNINGSVWGFSKILVEEYGEEKFTCFEKNGNRMECNITHFEKKAE